MKRILPVLLTFFILLTLPVHAAGGRLSATASASGDEVTITVRLDNPGIVATRVFVRYDSKTLRLTGAQNGDVFPKGNATFGKDLSSDPYTMLWDESLRKDNNTNSGTLCTVTFSVVGGTESGKTSVRFAVDKSSTFDVDLNNVAVADCTCSVDVPVVTTKASTVTTTTTTTTTKPTTATTTTTKAQPPATTTKPNATLPKPTIRPEPTATTTRITAASGQPTTHKPPEKFASAVSAAASSAAESAKEKASAAEGNAPSTAGEGTTAAQPGETKQAVSVSGETTPDNQPADGTLSTVPETQTEPLIDPEPPTNHRGLLWLLLLIPAFAAVILFIRKKKS